ncbi:MAG TPA: DUF4410 domain-containing protein [Pyrinomonadaceae bacterium]|nr:DUF4410 domain-containing protein [Pyrinomonadaceae bacterium]
MSYSRLRFIPGLFLVLLVCAPVLAQTAGTGTVKNKYQNIEVVKFDIQEGVNFPPESRDVIMAQVVEELKELKKFTQVSNVGETVPEGAGPTVRLTGTITKYKPGSRAKRYLIGFGAGATKVVAHIKYVDTATGNVLFEKDVDGKVWIGLFGGDSSGATRGLAKEVSKVTKKLLF